MTFCAASRRASGLVTMARLMSSGVVMLSYVYDHGDTGTGVSGSPRRSTGITHLQAATLHVHLDHYACLEGRRAWSGQGGAGTGRLCYQQTRRDLWPPPSVVPTVRVAPAIRTAAARTNTSTSTLRRPVARSRHLRPARLDGGAVEVAGDEDPGAERRSSAGQRASRVGGWKVRCTPSM